MTVPSTPATPSSYSGAAQRDRRGLQRTPAHFAAMGTLPPDVGFIPKPIEPALFIGTIRAAARAAALIGGPSAA